MFVLGRGEDFLFGVGWVALVVNKSLGMMSCLSLCTAL